jgi:hypothetical protein
MPTKEQFDSVVKKLSEMGYQLFDESFIVDGVVFNSEPREEDLKVIVSDMANPDLLVHEWSFVKDVQGGSFAITLHFDSDGDSVPYPVIELWYRFSDASKMLNKEPGIRGALATMSIREIMEHQIDIIPQYESLLTRTAMNMEDDAWLMERTLTKYSKRGKPQYT